MSIRNKLYLLSEADQKEKLLKMPIGATTTLSSSSSSSSSTATAAQPSISRIIDKKPHAIHTTPLKSKEPSHDDASLKRRLSSAALSSTHGTPAPSLPATKKAKPTRCITHSERMVKATKSKYRPFFTQTQEEADDSPRSSPLKDDYVSTLEYPGIGEYEKYGT
ncbi:hypothetical protein BCR42DRAFT_139437 [Absidia repens]|uniref:Uncharacterized protein n=1 Tax=Absidia repens TaxID=90262 RepID=A0A1X2IX74_9FUNG|nr:hypothetical protein BCR42DRAFT_139437 [Absidia repens]